VTVFQNLYHVEQKLPDKSLDLKILLFASLKERIGKSQIKVRVNEGCSLADFKSTLFIQYPELKPFSSSLIISINQNFAGPEQHIQSGDEIALFPPVSGG
jgi:molybdopterin converting factor subunit 1